MSFRITATPKFDREIKRLNKKYSSLKSDFAALISSLRENPTKGESLGGNCYKIRLSISSKNKGKSGGARVITYVVISETNVYLLSIYDKSEHESISDKELKKLLEDL